VLVVVQLGGGNDGLNTLVPLDGLYHDNRPTIGLSDDQLVPLAGTDRYGLHPAFAAMKGVLDAGKVATIASLGFTDPTRSHFVQMDEWWSGQPDKAAKTGWLGRYLDGTGGTGDSPLRAVALGGGVLSLQGETSRPTVVRNPKGFVLSSKRPEFNDAWQKVVGPTAVSATKAVDVFRKVRVDVEANGYDDSAAGGDINTGLATAAELIVSTPGVQVVNIAVGGFDTHAGQLATHEGLLADLAGGIQHFQDRIAAAGVADRVLLMTFSEFGRRVKENGSKGTDHGKAGVHFLVGEHVRGGLVGGWDLANLDDGDLRGTIDPRSLYSTALQWLGGDPNEVLGGRYDSLGIVT
jgi:uncharacterized protein (DUF1501 family)